jgi:hypothetical protein
MKRGLILLLLVFSSLIVLSQDLIVTTQGDTINCKISKVNSENVYFIYRHDLEIIDTVLNVTKIKTKQLNYFSRSEIPKDWNKGIGKFKPFQISIEGGLSLEIARLVESIPKELTGYYQNLKSGYNIGGSVLFYLDETIGIGLKYQCFLSSNSIENVSFTDPLGRVHTGDLSDKLKISFFGPVFSTRYPFGKGQNSVYTNYFAGPIFYKDDAIMPDPYKITGATIGLGAEGGYDIEISPNFLIGFQASLLAGVIKSVKIVNGQKVQSITLEKGSYESLLRIDFSIGLRFR